MHAGSPSWIFTSSWYIQFIGLRSRSQEQKMCVCSVCVSCSWVVSAFDWKAILFSNNYAPPHSVDLRIGLCPHVIILPIMIIGRPTIVRGLLFCSASVVKIPLLPPMIEHRSNSDNSLTSPQFLQGINKCERWPNFGASIVLKFNMLMRRYVTLEVAEMLKSLPVKSKTTKGPQIVHV